ncbi:FecCD family ABC transporter permease [Pseudomonas jinjuensis]|uniref:Iron complex transport system permease protein n=1 Tax=Pseudomonas jinjuensis TaxID=198616 RepID=A0A1H0PRN1_9PSED|nr:iron ABC transporter permease [Pseudomonas jinjuensis]SDP07787.1 iron complex transport system permease protein [Pseudomonas jinjuensis]
MSSVPATGRIGVWAMLAGALLACLLIALLAGKYPLRPADLWQSLAAHLGGDPGSVPERIETVLWNLRMPRILAALAVGASLSAAGAAYQSMFRNPLVSPDILGVSAGAGLGAVLAIFLGLSLPWVQLSAFCGGLLAVASVYLLASRVGRHDPVLVLVLAGVALSALLGAGISLLKVLSDPYTQLASITFWLLGGLNGVSREDLLGAAPLMLFGVLPLVLLRWRVNLLSLSDEEAAALGLNIVRTRRLLIVAATLMTASAVSITGIIGWIGLVVPHMARLLVGAEFSRLLPASLLLGAGFLLLTDTLARTVAAMELPLGILTALVGAPFFLVLLARGGRSA